MREIGATVFIDDQYLFVERAADARIRSLLFGAYPWNRFNTHIWSEAQLMTYDERKAAGVEIERREIELGEYLQRAKNWDEVITWVKRWEEQDVVEEGGYE